MVSNLQQRDAISLRHSVLNSKTLGICIPVKANVAQEHKRVTVNATGCGLRFPLGETKYLIFSFLRSGVRRQVKCGVEFRQLTDNE